MSSTPLLRSCRPASRPSGGRRLLPVCPFGSSFQDFCAVAAMTVTNQVPAFRAGQTDKFELQKTVGLLLKASFRQASEVPADTHLPRTCPVRGHELMECALQRPFCGRGRLKWAARHRGAGQFLEKSAPPRGGYTLQRTDLPCCCPQLPNRTSMIHWDSARLGAYRALLFKNSFLKRRKTKPATSITEKDSSNDCPVCPKGRRPAFGERRGRGGMSPRG